MIANSTPRRPPLGFHDKRLRSGPSLYDLPGEVRNEIWGLALPHGRNIKLQINTNMGTQRTYASVSIPSIFHICRESRCYALGVYVLGFGSDVIEEDKLWWNPETDRFFIPQTCYTIAISKGFDSGIEIPQTIIPSFPYDMFNKLQHLAMALNCRLLRSMNSGGIKWFYGFESLKTVSLVIDPDPMVSTHEFGLGYANALVLYEALDLPIISNPEFENYFSDFNHVPTPSKIERMMTRKAEEFIETHPEWKAPVFEVMVMGLKRTKRSGWCIPTNGKHTVKVVSKELMLSR